MSRINDLFEACQDQADGLADRLASWFGDADWRDDAGEVLAQTLDNMVPGWESPEARDDLVDVLSDPRKRISLIPAGHHLSGYFEEYVGDGWRDPGALARWIDDLPGSDGWEMWVVDLSSLDHVLTRLLTARSPSVTSSDNADRADEVWDEQAGRWRRERDGEWEYYDPDDGVWERWRDVDGTGWPHRYVEEADDWLPYKAESGMHAPGASARDSAIVEEPQLPDDLDAEEAPELSVEVKAELDEIVETQLLPEIQQIVAATPEAQMLSQEELEEALRDVLDEIRAASEHN